MDKPKFEDFGLTQEQYEILNKRDSKIFDVTQIVCGAIVAIVGGIIAFVEAYNASFTAIRIIPTVIFGGIMGVLGGLVLGVFVNWIMMFIRNHYFPGYKAVRAYDVAKREYDSWWTRRQVGFWTSMNGRRFEMELAYLYGQLGYGVDLTPTSGDKGIDIEMKKDGEKIIVQCKAHNKPVGPHTARDLYGTLINSKADKAILASTSGFTKGVREFVFDKPIELVSMGDIIRMQKSLDKE